MVAVSPSHRAAVDVRRRLISLLAAVSIFVVLYRTWPTVVDQSPWLGVILSAGYVAAFVLAAAVLLASDESVLDRLDNVVAGVAVAVFAIASTPALRPNFDSGDDEAYLGHDAVRAMLAGHNPYVAHYPGVASLPGLTPLLGGGAVTRYEYPPFSLEIGWVLGHVSRSLSEPQVVARLGVLLTAVVVFFALPRSLRAFAVPFVFGLDMLGDAGFLARPVMVALPLLCVVAHRWTSIGERGLLRAGTLTRAVALGLALATQQLCWLFAVFMLVALWRVRRGHLDRRASLAVVGGFTAVALVVFAAVSVPFLVDRPQHYLSALVSVFVQHAYPSGVGSVAVSLMALGHTGGLSYFSYAAGVLLLALLGIEAVAIRRVAAVVPLLMPAVLLLSTRSTPGYLIMFIPVWVVWKVTGDESMITKARPLLSFWTDRLRSGWRRNMALGVALLPAVVLTGFAIGTPPPLQISVRRAVVTTTYVTSLTVVVRNRSDRPVRVAYALSRRAGVDVLWRVARGPSTIRAHRRATVRIVPRIGYYPVVPNLVLFATSDRPASMTSVELALRRSQIVLVQRPTEAAARRDQQCTVMLIEGSSGSCRSSEQTGVR